MFTDPDGYVPSTAEDFEEVQPAEETEGMETEEWTEEDRKALDFEGHEDDYDKARDWELEHSEYYERITER